MDLKFLTATKSFSAFFGRRRNEIIGKSSLTLWANPVERIDMVNRLKANGFVEDFECKMLNKQSEARLCLTALKLYPEEGILEGSIIDITERKKAETEREIMIQFLKITNATFGTRDLITASLEFFSKTIRLRGGRN